MLESIHIENFAIIESLHLVEPDSYAERGYPHAEWAKLRQTAPIERFEPDGWPPFWAITRHADIVEISKNPQSFLNADGINDLVVGAPELNQPGQRGRVWPFFSGEFGHYLLALQGAETSAGSVDDELLMSSVRSMEYFANAGLGLPEQIWDGVGPNPFGYEPGQGTNAATPLAWTHAEYIKLLRSVSDGAVWDRYEIVEDRYADSPRNQPAD